jgi:uncharacterized pyridoxamine 5'-phosphate oxidase family protein
MDFWKEIYASFKQTQPVYLSTVDGKRPRVRPVTLIFFNDGFWVATGSGDAKVKQIYNNENVEFCLMIRDEKNAGYIRGSGVAQLVEELDYKTMIADNIGFIKEFWQNPSDLDFTLLKIVLQEVEYLPVGQMLAIRKKIEL